MIIKKLSNLKKYNYSNMIIKTRKNNKFMQVAATLEVEFLAIGLSRVLSRIE